MPRLAVLLLALYTSLAPAAETLTNFLPSNVVSAFGPTKTVEFATPLMELEPGSLAHHLPAAMRNMRFAEPVWVIGYKTSILDPSGQPPRENFLCHTFLADQHVDQHPENELKGIYSDAFTPDVRLPGGFGVLFTPNDPLHWMPMFNNRAGTPARVAMKVTLTVIRARELKQPLRPLYSSLRSVQVPHLFFVQPGHDERTTRFTVPADSVIHFLGTHLHPYGASIELFNVSRNQLIWRGRRTAGPDSPMETYSSSTGYPVSAGEILQVKSVYENPSKEPVDAMAGIFLMYSRN